MKYGIIAALVFAGLVAACDADAQIIDIDAGFYAGGGIDQFNLEIDNANALWLTGAFRY